METDKEKFDELVAFSNAEKENILKWLKEEEFRIQKLNEKKEVKEKRMLVIQNAKNLFSIKRLYSGSAVSMWNAYANYTTHLFASGFSSIFSAITDYLVDSDEEKDETDEEFDYLEVSTFLWQSTHFLDPDFVNVLKILQMDNIHPLEFEWFNYLPVDRRYKWEEPFKLFLYRVYAEEVIIVAQKVHQVCGLPVKPQTDEIEYLFLPTGWASFFKPENPDEDPFPFSEAPLVSWVHVKDDPQYYISPEPEDVVFSNTTKIKNKLQKWIENEIHLRIEPEKNPIDQDVRNGELTFLTCIRTFLQNRNVKDADVVHLFYKFENGFDGFTALEDDFSNRGEYFEHEALFIPGITVLWKLFDDGAIELLNDDRKIFSGNFSSLASLLRQIDAIPGISKSENGDLSTYRYQGFFDMYELTEDFVHSLKLEISIPNSAIDPTRGSYIMRYPDNWHTLLLKE